MQHPRDLAQPALPSLRQPQASDGAAIWELVRACKPLDENSMYCNLIQCDHFAGTCVIAELDGKICGWVSGYVLPNDPGTLFVWQVAVAPEARGKGLGTVMLQNVMNREACKNVTRLQTTITAENEASWTLFRRFAKRRGTSLDVQPYYTQALHFRERHKTEHMVTIDLEERMKKAA